MKYRIIFLLSLWLCSCSDYEKVLEQSDAINVILLETSSLPVGNPGDTVSFKVLATTNDIIKRVEITEKSHDFQPLGGKIRYEIVDNISVDEAGYFSRDVRSIVVNYPVLLNDVSIGDTLSMKFTFTTDKGVSSSVLARVKVGNYIFHSIKLVVGGHPITATGGRFYSAVHHKPYTEDTYVPRKDSVDVIVFSDQLSANEYSIRFMSPGCQKTQEQIDGMMNAVLLNYDYTTMLKTQFIKVELPWLRIGDEEVRQLDFTHAMDEIDVAVGDRIGFLTQDGRKGVILVEEMVGFKIAVRTKIQKIVE